MKELNKNFYSIIPEASDIVILHAHSDDESFLTAGIINELVCRGHRVFVVYCACAVLPKEEKTAVRYRELQEACEVLGGVKVVLLEFCELKYDSGQALSAQSVDFVVSRIIYELGKLGVVRPVVLSYDKNGGYGNSDHIAVHRVGRALVKSSFEIAGLLEVTIYRDLYLTWLIQPVMDSNYLPKLKYWSRNFGLSDDEIDFYFTLSSEQLLLKKQALTCHASQILKEEFPLVLTEDDFKKLFGREYFAYYRD